MRYAYSEQDFLSLLTDNGYSKILNKDVSDIFIRRFEPFVDNYDYTCPVNLKNISKEILNHPVFRPSMVLNPGYHFSIQNNGPYSHILTTITYVKTRLKYMILNAIIYYDDRCKFDSIEDLLCSHYEHMYRKCLSSENIFSFKPVIKPADFRKYLIEYIEKYRVLNTILNLAKNIAKTQFKTSIKYRLTQDIKTMMFYSSNFNIHSMINNIEYILHMLVHVGLLNLEKSLHMLYFGKYNRTVSVNFTPKIFEYIKEILTGYNPCYYSNTISLSNETTYCINDALNNIGNENECYILAKNLYKYIEDNYYKDSKYEEKILYIISSIVYRSRIVTKLANRVLESETDKIFASDIKSYKMYLDFIRDIVNDEESETEYMNHAKKFNPGVQNKDISILLHSARDKRVSYILEFNFNHHKLFDNNTIIDYIKGVLDYIDNSDNVPELLKTTDDVYKVFLNSNNINNHNLINKVVRLSKRAINNKLNSNPLENTGISYEGLLMNYLYKNNRRQNEDTK